MGQSPALRALQTTTFKRVLTIGLFYYTYRATELAVLSWYVLTLTSSDLMVALVGVSRIGPMFVFGLVAGGLADRFVRKQLMVAVQLANLVSAAAMALVLVLGFDAYWFAYIAIGITGTTWTVDYAARRALLGDLFKGAQLTTATSMDAGLVTGSNMIGPLIGTAMVRYSDFAGAYLGIVGLSMSAFALVATIKVLSQQNRVTNAGPKRHISDALSMMRHNRVVLGAVLLTSAFNIFGWPFVQLVPVVATESFGASEIAYGLLISGLGAGAIVGSVLIATVQPSRKGDIYSLGAALFMVSELCFVFAPWYWLAFGCMFIAGVGLAGFAAMQPVIPLESVKSDERGKAMGAVALGIGAQAPGMLVMGIVSEVLGPTISIALAATMGLLFIVILRRLFPALCSKP